MIVTQIWRYPVKSMGGESLTSAGLGEHGIDGDRSWGVRDLVTNTILTGRREPRLLMASARWAGSGPVISLPDGATATTSEQLSTWLDRPVELVAAGATHGTFENPLDIDHETDWVSWQSRLGSFHDGRSTVSIVSTASLADFEPPRFRINLIVDGAGEDDLIGRHVTLGSAGLDVRKPIDRCVMVARAQQGGIAADLSVLKRVIADRGNLMGVGATVQRPGAISVGDRLEVVGASA